MLDFEEFCKYRKMIPLARALDVIAILFFSRSTVTECFAILKPYNLSIEVSVLHKISWPVVFLRLLQGKRFGQEIPPGNRNYSPTKCFTNFCGLKKSSIEV